MYTQRQQFSIAKINRTRKQLAREWNCGFLAMDNLEDNIDILLTLMIRDIIERK